MLKLEGIVEVHQLKKQGFKISAIARKCNLSRTTVYEYLEMDLEEAYVYLASRKCMDWQLNM